MTNEEWLESLAHNDIPGLRAWFKAEHSNDALQAEVAMCSHICVVVSEQREQIAELTAERDNWKANCEDWKKDCERYRSKFGKCIDYADAIHALMDEGLA